MKTRTLEQQTLDLARKNPTISARMLEKKLNIWMDSAHSVLSRLCKKGGLERVSVGLYRLPGKQTEVEVESQEKYDLITMKVLCRDKDTDDIFAALESVYYEGAGVGKILDCYWETDSNPDVVIEKKVFIRR